MKRIIWHWSAGAHTPSDLDKQHYHFIIDGAGKVHPGKFAPEANEKPQKGKYAAHTLNCNTGSIGIAVAAMAGAVERPFNAGSHPITPAQVDALVTLSRKLGAQYGIPVTPETMLSHAEVQPVLGIKQRGKWDIAWLPGMAIPGDPVAVGNKLRARVKSPPVTRPAPHVTETPKIEHVQNRTNQNPIKKPAPAGPAIVVGGIIAAAVALVSGHWAWLTSWF
jgi:hypothetical protein